MGRKPKSPEMFWASVAIGDPASCWLWTGAIHRDGYGKCGWHGRTVGAHRVAYALASGEPLTVGNHWDNIIRHTCDNRLCCNPAHLLPGTAKDNMHDTVERGRHRFKNNPPKGSRAPWAKLTPDQVRTIREHHSNNTMSQSAMARLYGVHTSTIFLIVHERNWSAEDL